MEPLHSAQQERNGDGSEGPKGPDAAQLLLKRVEELLVYFSHYTSVQGDLFRARVRSTLNAMLLSVLGGVLAVALVCVAAVFMVSGAAEMLSNAADISTGAANVLVGALVILVIIGGTAVFTSYSATKSLARTTSIYARMNHTELAKFGRNVNLQAERKRKLRDAAKGQS